MIWYIYVIAWFINSFPNRDFPIWEFPPQNSLYSKNGTMYYKIIMYHIKVTKKQTFANFSAPNKLS